MEKTFLLHVTYHAKPGCARAFVEELEASGVAAAVRAEDGCIHYDYYFSAMDENEVLLFEEWTSQAHQQIHMTQPHMPQLRQIKEKYIQDTVLRIL